MRTFFIVFSSVNCVLVAVLATLVWNIWNGHILTPQEQKDFLAQVTEVRK